MADIWWPPFLFISLLLLIFGSFRDRAFATCTMISLLLGQTLVSARLKEIIGRPRPRQMQTVRTIDEAITRPAFLTIFKRPTISMSTVKQRAIAGTSFPSGHAFTAAVMATCCSIFYRRWGKLYWIIAFAIAWSRVYAGDHWPSDVLAAFPLAIAQTLLTLGICEVIWKKFVLRWVPNLALRYPSLIAVPRKTRSAAVGLPVA